MLNDNKMTTFNNKFKRRCCWWGKTNCWGERITNYYCRGCIEIRTEAGTADTRMRALIGGVVVCLVRRCSLSSYRVHMVGAGTRDPPKREQHDVAKSNLYTYRIQCADEERWIDNTLDTRCRRLGPSLAVESFRCCGWAVFCDHEL